jgi:hypothetical protein
VRTVAVIVLALCLFVSGGNATAAPIVEEDTVANLITTPPDAPVRVAFGRHAAIYQLARDDPNFVAWQTILQTAQSQGTRVRFAYDVVGPWLTLVEPA